MSALRLSLVLTLSIKVVNASDKLISWLKVEIYYNQPKQSFVFCWYEIVRHYIKIEMFNRVFDFKRLKIRQVTLSIGIILYA